MHHPLGSVSAACSSWPAGHGRGGPGGRGFHGSIGLTCSMERGIDADDDDDGPVFNVGEAHCTTALKHIFVFPFCIIVAFCPPSGGFLPLLTLMGRPARCILKT